MRIKTLISSAGNLGAADLVLRFTAIDLLMRPMGPWGVRPLILGLASLCLILPGVLRAPITWYALAGLVTTRIIADWPIPDNHIYLLAYWCLALALSIGSANVQRVLAKSSRLLIGLAFLLAVLWKGLLSPDYLDGRFFRVTLLTDSRFEDATQLLGGLTAKQLDDNRDYLTALPEGAVPHDPPELVEPRALRRLALALTWGGLIGESLVAAFHLFPLSGRWTILSHLLLLIFCALTYAIAPVAGFGWLLLTMGLASCPPEHRVIRGTYIAAWILIVLYAEVPWAGVLLEWFRNSPGVTS